MIPMIGHSGIVPKSDHHLSRFFKLAYLKDPMPINIAGSEIL